jgi:RNA recognition motif. (a.k.a. RRM, RBD, or RNP domain)
LILILWMRYKESAVKLIDKMAVSFFSDLLNNDPELHAIYYHKIRWGDVPFTPEEEKMRQDFMKLPEQIKLQQSISHELKKLSFNTPKTIIAHNLPNTITISELYSVFGEFGPIYDISVPYYSKPNSPNYGKMRLGCFKGYAYIKYIYSDDAFLALSKSSHITIHNQIITTEVFKY